MTVEFTPWPKTPRLFRDCVITEKIDGSNAAIGILEGGEIVYAQSRNRIITPGRSTDNAGFAQWVEENRDTLIGDLGEGLHFGEWWGQGINRNYGLTEKRFSLFNVNRWNLQDKPRFLTPRLGVVPTLLAGLFDTVRVRMELDFLRLRGSVAAPGFMNPEGVVIYHTASRSVFKALIENDEQPKGQTE